MHKPQYEIEEKPVLPVETLRAIISELDGVYRLLVIVLSVFGIRLGEGLALRWLDVDFDGARLAINHSLWRGSLKSPKTKASERKFHIPASLLNLLSEHQAISPFNGPGDFIFCNSIGQPLDPDNLRHRVLYPVLDQLEIKREDRRYGFHIFRHTAGPMLYAKTGNLKLAQEALGQAQMSTTSNIYLHNERVVADTATEVLVDAILGNCDYFVTETSRMVS
ncbi:MAG: site-specific integrase [Blastocatellia bacterium]